MPECRVKHMNILYTIFAILYLPVLLYLLLGLIFGSRSKKYACLIIALAALIVTAFNVPSDSIVGQALYFPVAAIIGIGVFEIGTALLSSKKSASDAFSWWRKKDEAIEIWWEKREQATHELHSQKNQDGTPASEKNEGVWMWLRKKDQAISDWWKKREK